MSHGISQVRSHRAAGSGLCRRLRPMVAVATACAVALTAGASCGSESAIERAEKEYSERVGANTGDEIGERQLLSVDDFGDADVVVIARVGELTDVPIITSNEFEGKPKSYFADTSFVVEKVLGGPMTDPDETFTVRLPGHTDYPEEGRVETSRAGTKVKPGDRVLVGLMAYRVDDLDAYLLADDAVFFLVDGQVVDTPRESRVIRQLEALSEDQLVTEVQLVIKAAP